MDNHYQDINIKQVEKLQLVDLISCPDCGKTCLQRNIYRHLCQQHHWSREECKQLISVIRSEKKFKTAGSSYSCASCSVVFKSIHAMIRHRRRCFERTGNDEDGYTEESTDPTTNDEEAADDYSSGQTYSMDKQEGDVHVKAENDNEGIELVVPDPPAFRQLISPFRAVIPRPPPELSSKINRAAQLKANSQDSDGTQGKSDSPLTSPLKLSKKEVINKFSLGSKYRNTSTACPVPDCRKNVDSAEELVLHCKLYHETENTKYNVEKKVFKTFQDFKRWFDQRQEDSCTSLTKRTGHGGETFYRCHMVGKYSSVAKKRRSNPRKLDQSCTAFLKVFVQTDGTTFATGCFTHIGHELNHRLLWLTETQEKYVRELLDLGWSSEQVFYYIREEYNNFESKLKYISKNDIRNISVRYERLKKKMLEEKKVDVISSDSAESLNGSDCSTSRSIEDNFVEEDVEGDHDYLGKTARLYKKEDEEQEPDARPKIEDCQTEEIVVDVESHDMSEQMEKDDQKYTANSG